MSRTRSTSRRGARVALLTILAMLSTLAQTSVADAGDGYARELMRIVNRTRDNHDLRPLRMERSLNAPSRRHTNKMIRSDRVYDPPNLAAILSDYDYQLGADVVGCAMSLRQLHRVLMTERFHRMILLHPDLRRIGIGVVVNGRRNGCGRGSFWATEIMYG
jgi:uncharacterized protein YkwD